MAHDESHDHSDHHHDHSLDHHGHHHHHHHGRSTLPWERIVHNNSDTQRQKLPSLSTLSQSYGMKLNKLGK